MLRWEGVGLGYGAAELALTVVVVVVENFYVAEDQRKIEPGDWGDRVGIAVAGREGRLVMPPFERGDGSRCSRERFGVGLVLGSCTAPEGIYVRHCLRLRGL